MIYPLTTLFSSPFSQLKNTAVFVFLCKHVLTKKKGGGEKQYEKI